MPLNNDVQEISGLVAASAQEAHVIKGKRVRKSIKLKIFPALFICHGAHGGNFIYIVTQATCKKAEVRQGKIYVGKLPAEELSNQDLTDHFNQVGAAIHLPVCAKIFLFPSLEL